MLSGRAVMSRVATVTNHVVKAIDHEKVTGIVLGHHAKVNARRKQVVSSVGN